MKPGFKKALVVLGAIYVVACGISWVVRHNANSGVDGGAAQAGAATVTQTSSSSSAQATPHPVKPATTDEDGWRRVDENSPIDGVLYRAVHESNGNMRGQILQTVISCSPGKKELSATFDSIVDDPAYDGFLHTRIFGLTSPEGRVKTASEVTATTFLVTQTKYKNSADLDLNQLVQRDVVALLIQKGSIPESASSELGVSGHLLGNSRDVYSDYVNTQGIVEFVQNKLPVIVELNDTTGKLYFNIPKGNQVVDGVLDQCRAHGATTVAGKQQRQPSTAPKPSSPESSGDWSTLEAQIGKYPQDIALFNNSPISGDLAALLGPRFTVFKTNTEAQGPLQKEGSTLYMTGVKPHEGGSEQAYLLIDPTSRSLEVGLWEGGHLSVFRSGAAIPTKPKGVARMIE